MIRWGILSTAKIGTAKVIPAMMKCSNASIDAIASRDITVAQNAANSLGIKKAYGSYEELLADPNIDAIYNPLPNHMHVEWTIKAMESGKHVLCEKPFALKSEKILPVIKLKEELGLKVGEAFMVKTNPQWLKVKEIINSGEIGDLCFINGFFSYFNTDENNIRNINEYGGGALWDIGCYPITTSRFIFNEEPTHVSASIDRDSKFKTDKLITSIMEFPSGKAHFTASTQLNPYQRMQFMGSKKMIELLIPFNAPNDAPCKLIIRDGDLFGKTDEIIEFPINDQYTLQGEAFSNSIINDTVEPVTLHDAYNNTKVIEALFSSAQERCFIKV